MTNQSATFKICHKMTRANHKNVESFTKLTRANHKNAEFIAKWTGANCKNETHWKLRNMSEEDLLIALLKSMRNLAELYKSKSSNSKI